MIDSFAAAARSIEVSPLPRVGHALLLPLLQHMLPFLLLPFPSFLFRFPCLHPLLLLLLLEITIEGLTSLIVRPDTKRFPEVIQLFRLCCCARMYVGRSHSLGFIVGVSTFGRRQGGAQPRDFFLNLFIVHPVREAILGLKREHQGLMHEGRLTPCLQAPCAAPCI